MERFKNLQILLKFLLSSAVIKPRKKEKINKVHAITFRIFSPEGGKGGGSAVQSCENILLGDKYDDLELKYTYFEENKYSRDWKTRLSDLWGGTFFAIQKTKDEKNCVYITHDYGTGFGLALLKKKFVYVSHLQGPRVEEKINYNEFMTSLDIKIIKFCERYVFKHALYVCFPSKGAKDYYFSSIHRSINRESAKIGGPLYNTIYANPDNQKVDNIDRDTDYITILSTGALTDAKGIDRIPDLLRRYLPLVNKKVRWIVIGSGYLKDKIIESGITLENDFNNFQFIFKESCSYPEVRYLVSISDIYLMMHRVSIFDLATLEAMKEGLCVALSKEGGNLDFNKNDNIVFIDNDNESAKILSEIDIPKNGEKNKHTYENHFSNKNFIDSYRSVIDDLRNSETHSK